MDAINQLFYTFMCVLLVLGWIGIAMALSGLAIFIYRIIRMALR